ncbi:hypothetical protein TSUD_45900 [Trifolium subterraneum]|nr:hypothetical protein TSUD_45900 [Trifolium subterraneum]
MDATKNRNFPFSNKQEEDDYWFHEYIVSLLSVEEAVSIDELLGKKEPDAGYACHHSLEPSSQHTKIEVPQAMQYNPCSSEQVVTSCGISPQIGTTSPHKNICRDFDLNKAPSFDPTEDGGSSNSHLLAPEVVTSCGTSPLIGTTSPHENIRHDFNLNKAPSFDPTEDGGSSNSHLLAPEVVTRCDTDTSPHENIRRDFDLNKNPSVDFNHMLGIRPDLIPLYAETASVRDQALRRESIAIGSQTKFEKHFQTVPDDDDSSCIP